MMLYSDKLKKFIPPLPIAPLSIEVVYKAKLSYPLVPSTSPEGTIGQNIAAPQYSQEQHSTWGQLLKKHSELVPQYLCQEYIRGLNSLHFNMEHIANLSAVSEALKKQTDWQIMRVEGLVAPKTFFNLLANKLFPCTDFIRHKDEIDYTPAPDTFHDQVGHLPMIADKRFAEFFYLFGLAGSNAKTEQELEWLNRIYWFTVEFGVINPTAHLEKKRENQQCRIYGAGISSSCGEILYCLSDKVQKHPFQIDIVAQTPFDIHHMQEKIFEISSFDELESEFRNWTIKKGILCA